MSYRYTREMPYPESVHREVKAILDREAKRLLNERIAAVDAHAREHPRHGFVWDDQANRVRCAKCDWSHR